MPMLSLCNFLSVLVQENFGYASGQGQLDRVKRIWFLSPMRAAKVQASLRIRARSLASLNGWACAVKMCHDGMLEDTNSLDGAQLWAFWHSLADCANDRHLGWATFWQ